MEFCFVYYGMPCWLKVKTYFMIKVEIFTTPDRDLLEPVKIFMAASRNFIINDRDFHVDMPKFL